MRHTLLSRCSRGLIASILAPALCATAPAKAEIFKCFAKDKTPIYQNFPCQFDSLGSLPSSPPSAKTTLPPDGASQAKARAAPVDVASSAKSAKASPKTQVNLNP